MLQKDFFEQAFHRKSTQLEKISLDSTLNLIASNPQKVPENQIHKTAKTAVDWVAACNRDQYIGTLRDEGVPEEVV